MSVVSMRDAIVTRLKEAVPSLRAVEAHGGAVDEATLDRYQTNSPSAFVTCLGPGTMEEQSDVVGVWRWGIFILARDATSPKQPRHDVAVTFAEAIAGLVALERWSDTASGNASDVRVLNLFTDGLDSRGLAVWVVEWTQGTVAVPADSFDDLDDFLRAHTAYAVGATEDTVTPVDDLDLPQEEP